MEHRFDEIDRRVLYHLAKDARNTSAPMIAEEVDVSAATIRNRIRQLEQADVVRGYHAAIDYERIENRITNLFICSTPVPDRAKLAKHALTVPGVVNVRELMAGRGNLHVLAIGTDTNDMTRIAREISNLGIEIEEEDLIQQEYFHPYEPFGPDDGPKPLSMADFMSLAGGAEVVELTVVETAEITGKTLKEASDAGIFGDDVLVVAIERGDSIITPKGNTEISAGDIVTIFTREGIPDETLRAFTDGSSNRI